MGSKIKVFIDGSEGTTGLRIFERFSGREDVELLKIAPEFRKDPAARKELLNAADIAFLCLPDAAAIEAVSLVENPSVGLIDTSTAHRTNPTWSYGFPELSPDFRKRIASSKRIAVPGCHASGFVALAYPLVSSGIMPADYPAVCFSLTGYSGGGKKMIAQYKAEDRETALSSPRQYGLSQQHKHLKEMLAVSGLAAPPVFCPIVDDFYSGMAVSLPLFTDRLSRPMGRTDIEAFFKEYYAGERFVTIYEDESGFLAANALSGKDDMQIVVTGNDERVVVTARFDNLGKGASGAAIQCMNLMIGADEATGLVL